MECGAVAAGGAEDLVGGHGLCFESEHFAGAGENRVPAYFEVGAFEAIGSARWKRTLVCGCFLIAHVIIITE